MKMKISDRYEYICTIVKNSSKRKHNIWKTLLDVDIKINHFFPGTDIPKYNEKKLFIDQPKFAFILSWHIAEEIMNNLRKNGFKGKFIIPLPEPKILD